MSSRISCPSCKAQYKVPPSFKGSSVKCKRCSATISLTSSSSPSRRPTTGSSAKRAVHMRSRRAQTALGMATRKRTLQPIYILTGALSLAALVAIVILVAV